MADGDGRRAGVGGLDDMAVEVRAELPAPPERVFALLTDVERVAGLGPEHAQARWTSAGPGVGATFIGVNEREGRRWEVLCTVTRYEPPVAFDWAVGDVDSPTARWSYRLSPQGDRTVVTQQFRHGPGWSFLRRACEKHPEQAAEFISARAHELETNMRAVLQAAARLLTEQPPGSGRAAVVPGPLAVLDWRRRVFALYAEIRATADAAAAHELWRVTRDDLFATHPASPLLPEQRASFAGLPVAPYDPAWRFEAPIETDVEPASLAVPTGTDGVVPFDRLGVVPLPGLGALDVWWLGSYGGGVFLPVKDASSGRSTYGGGRYLLDTVKGADLGGDVRDGVLVLDLNFAYNPSCAYDPAWACPLAPLGNVLAAEVPVGERG